MSPRRSTTPFSASRLARNSGTTWQGKNSASTPTPNPRSDSERTSVMNQKWINFKVLREQLDFAEVLRHYRVELKRKKNQLVGFCPLPNHNGQRNSPSFSVNSERKCFNCFGCHRGGNCLDFAIYMEGKDPENRQHVREVALLLQERFHLNGAANQKRDARPSQRNAAGGTTPAKHSPKQAETDRVAREKPSEDSARPVIVNAPL